MYLSFYNVFTNYISLNVNIVVLNYKIKWILIMMIVKKNEKVELKKFVTKTKKKLLLEAKASKSIHSFFKFRDNEVSLSEFFYNNNNNDKNILIFNNIKLLK